MTRRTFLHRSAGVGAVLSAQTKKRKIVFILTDDHRYNMMGCARHPCLKAGDRQVAIGIAIAGACPPPSDPPHQGTGVPEIVIEAMHDAKGIHAPDNRPASK